MVKRRKVRSSSAKPFIVVLALVAVIIGGWLFISTNQNGANEVVISPDVVVYEEGVSGYSIISSDSSTVTVSSSEGLEVGKIMSAGISEEAPDGLLRKITAIEEDDGQFVLRTQQAALTEAIEKCDVSATVTFEEDGTYRVEQSGLASDSPLAIQQAFANEPLSNFFSYSMGNGIEASAGNAIDIDLRIENGEVNLRLTNRFYAGLEMEPLSLDIDIFDKDLAPFEFMVGPIPIVFENHLNVGFAAEAAVDGLDYGMGAALDKTVGFEYSTRDGLKGISEDASKAPSFSFSLDSDIARLSLDAGLSAVLGSYLYGVAGPELTIGLNNETELYLQAIPDDEDSAGAIELPDVNTKLRGSLFEKVTVPISGRLKAEGSINPFDSVIDLSALIDIELFDTGDMITLLEVDETFGKIQNVPKMSEADLIGCWVIKDFYDPAVSSRLFMTDLYAYEDHYAIIVDAMSSSDRPYVSQLYAWKLVENEYIFTIIMGDTEYPPIVVAQINEDGALVFDKYVCSEVQKDASAASGAYYDVRTGYREKEGWEAISQGALAAIQENDSDYLYGKVVAGANSNGDELILLQLEIPTTIKAYDNQTQSLLSKRISTAKLPDKYAIYKGQTLIISAASWGIWPSDTRGALFEIDLDNSDDLRVVGR